MLIITLLVLLVVFVVFQKTIWLYMSGLMALRLLLVTIDIVLCVIIALAYLLAKRNSGKQ